MVTVEQVRLELEKTKSRKARATSGVWTLLWTFVLFAVLGFFRNSPSMIGLIVVVLLVHETGHLLGMKWFGYRDVRMFFIPLFGAAVSGSETNPHAAKKAVIALLGPVPGILLGCVSMVLFWVSRQPLWATATRAFLWINVFNLFPFHPLDGGRLMDVVLFSRHPFLELAFKAVAAAGLFLVAFLFHSWFLGVFAFFVLASLPSTYLSAATARSIREETGEDVDGDPEEIPEPLLDSLVRKLEGKIPKGNGTPRVYAGYVRQIWQRVLTRKCSALAAAVLLGVYLFFLAFGAGALVLFEMVHIATAKPDIRIVTEQLGDGTNARFEIQTLFGNEVSRVRLDDQGQYHGIQVIRNGLNQVEIARGEWVHGKRHGEWIFKDDQGKPEAKIDYDSGKIRAFYEHANGTWRKCPPPAENTGEEIEPRSLLRQGFGGPGIAKDAEIPATPAREDTEVSPAANVEE